jgi:pyruvate dehydrogenase E2 component (dihydrolipoamide acetyltransferase)
MAVARDEGLIVPVLKGADGLTLGEIALQCSDLAERAREGKLTPDQVTGGTFTVSNLGMFGVEQFTAIINPPESAILAVGTLGPEPVVLDGKIEVRQRMRATLSVDHRVADGALAGRFLQDLQDSLEHPGSPLR